MNTRLLQLGMHVQCMDRSRGFPKAASLGAPAEPGPVLDGAKTLKSIIQLLGEKVLMKK